MAALSDYLENRLVDFLLRGQGFTPPATVYVALYASNPTEASGAGELSGGGYARAPIACTLANWAATQGAGTTAASIGATGTTSNNVPVTFAPPSTNWGEAKYIAVFDALTGGNMLWYAQLVASKIINSGDPAPTFPATTISLQLDD